jgi:hypothetical protein
MNGSKYFWYTSRRAERHQHPEDERRPERGGEPVGDTPQVPRIPGHPGLHRHILERLNEQERHAGGKRRPDEPPRRMQLARSAGRRGAENRRGVKAEQRDREAHCAQREGVAADARAVRTEPA